MKVQRTLTKLGAHNYIVPPVCCSVHGLMDVERLSDCLDSETKLWKPPDYDFSVHVDPVEFILDPKQLVSIEQVLKHYVQWNLNESQLQWNPLRSELKTNAP